MIYLVDANVLSEPTRPQPSPKVVRWLRDHERNLVVDPIILGELRFGVDRMPAGRRRARLEEWFAQAVSIIRCIPWDAACGLRWGQLLADLRARGQAMPLKDSLIAATALLHGLTIATRNVRDFQKAGVRCADPF